MTDKGPDATYADYLQGGDWRIQKCTSCGSHVFHPRLICPTCKSVEFEWVKPSGDGTVHSTTVIRRKPERGGAYNVALVDLAEGCRMMSRVDGITPTEVKIGMKVSASLAEKDGQKLVVFTPSEGGAA